MKKSASPLRIAPLRKAFTMIELLTVIAVIGILASILIPAVGGARATALKSRLRAEFSQIAQACIMYKNDYGYFPMGGATQKDFGDKELLYVLSAPTGNQEGAVKAKAGNPRLTPYYSHGNTVTSGNTWYPVDSAGNSEIVVVFSDSTERIPKIAKSEIDGVTVKSGNVVDGWGNNVTVNLANDVRLPVAVFSAGDGKTAVGNWSE